MNTQKIVVHPPLSIDRELGGAIPQTERPLPGRNDRTLDYRPFIAGGVGSMVAATTTAPFDVIKTRLQGDFYVGHMKTGIKGEGIVRAGARHINETFGLLNNIFREEGARALFKGLGPNLLGVVPARAIHFWAYRNTKAYLATKYTDGEEPVWLHIGSAAIAGVITGTATNPIWVVKTRLQLDKNRATQSMAGRQYKNSLECISKTFRNEGIKGFYKGLSASFLGISESAIQWVLYERLKKLMAARSEQIKASGLPLTTWDEVLDLGGMAAAGGGAKFVATAVTYPHEVVRTRLRQAPTADGNPKYTGLVQCFRHILKNEGGAALYGGMTSHFFKVVPSSAIMFLVYEGVMKVMGAETITTKP